MTNAPKPLPPEVLKELLREYLKGVDEKIKQLQKLIAELKIEVSLERVTALRFIVHKMAGNAGTYGFSTVSDVCKAWDTRLMDLIAHFSERGSDRSWVGELDSLLKTIQEGFKPNG